MTDRSNFWLKMEEQACRLLSWYLSFKAKDQTAALTSGSALILAPHADDETIGCGGLIARKCGDGMPVDVVVATDGSASHLDEPTLSTTRENLMALRQSETTEACAHLGVASGHIHFFGLKDGELSQHMGKLEAEIATLVTALRPSQIYVCAISDGHRDHKALSQAVRNLAPRLDAKIYEYPVWTFDFRSWRASGMTNKGGYVVGLWRMFQTAFGWKVVSLSLTDVAGIKRVALEKHRSQLGLLPAEPDWSGLPENFLAHFFKDKELFFELEQRNA